MRYKSLIFFVLLPKFDQNREIRIFFKYLKLILLTTKFLFQQYIVCWGKFFVQKLSVGGGGGGLSLATSAFYYVKLYLFENDETRTTIHIYFQLFFSFTRLCFLCNCFTLYKVFLFWRGCAALVKHMYIIS